MTGRALLAVLVVFIVVALVMASRGDASRADASRAAICATFKPCGPALRVAYCESWLNPFALGRAGERGLFQIHPVHFGWLDERRLFEPLYNARAAFRLSRGGRTWRAWTCRP